MFFIYRLYNKKKIFLEMACHTPSGVARIVKLSRHRDCTLLKSALIGRWIVLIIPQEVRKKKNSAFIFQLPGWALVAPSYFTLLASLLS